MLRIALGQMNATVGDLSGNTRRILEFIDRAKAKDADIIAFPELVISGYPPEDLLLKNHFIQDARKRLLQLAKQVEDIVVVVGFPYQEKGSLYNAAAVIRHKRIGGYYFKQHLPNYGVFDEKRYFYPGQEAKVFRLGPYLFGVNICEDIWIPGGVCAKQAGFGAGLLINLSSSPYDMGKLKDRKRILQKASQQSNSYVAYVNLVGGQDELVFDGNSFIYSPKGEMIASGRSFEEDLIIADLHVKAKRTSRKRKNVVSLGDLDTKPYKKPLNRHIIPEQTTVERVYHALTLGTRDYIEKNGFRKVCIGLSGGVDSALVAAIAVDALGSERVIGVTMPSTYTSKGTLKDAMVLAQNLGIELKRYSIKQVFHSYLALFKRTFRGMASDVAEENLQARIRGNILMALSNKFGWLVLTTGNKSEVAVGYCTLYGDMSGGFAVLKDVPKTLVYELCQFRNHCAGRDLIPQSILKRAPSAELRANQKDRDSLPSYDLLDRVLKGYVEKHLSYDALARGRNAAVVKRVVSLIERNEYKRRQAPPGIKITPRAFGKDWRLPITNKYKEF